MNVINPPIENLIDLANEAKGLGHQEISHEIVRYLLEMILLGKFSGYELVLETEGIGTEQNDLIVIVQRTSGQRLCLPLTILTVETAVRILKFGIRQEQLSKYGCQLSDLSSEAIKVRIEEIHEILSGISCFDDVGYSILQSEKDAMADFRV